MAVLSTLQNIATEVDTATVYMQQSGGTSHPVTNGARSITGHGVYDTPAISAADLVHGSHCTTTAPAGDFMISTSSVFLTEDSEYNGAPADGDTVWYCSNCSNGPMGTWYSACPECGHAYCGACTVEETR